MSALAYSYSEPYRFPAGMLALIVHGAFFSLLYFGVNWRTEPPQGMVVDIWASLPAPQVEPVKVVLPPVPEPPKPVEPPKLAEPIAPPKADIELAVKKVPKVKPLKPQEPPKPVEIKPVQPAKTEPVKVEQKVQPVPEAVSEQERIRAAQAAAAAKAIENEVAKYTGLIRSRIRHSIVMPPDMDDRALAEYDVTLLPDGEMLGEPKLVKSSGNYAYDAAVERAILKEKYFSLPPSLAARKEFLSPNKLHLKFSPKE